MGATSFLHIVKTTDPQQGYVDLVKEAYYEYGHDSYNGTISTTTKCVEHFQHFNSDAEVQDWLNGDEPWSITEKWGACKFVRLPDSDKIAYFGWAAC